MSFNNPGYPPGPGNLGALSDPGEDEESTKGKKKKPVTRKVVNRQIGIAVVLAIIVAAVGAFLLLGSGPSTWVAVAKTNINVATKITPEMVEGVAVDQKQVVAGAITGASQDEVLANATKAFSGGARANQPIPAKAQISTYMLSAGQVLAEDLKPNERLISIHATVARAVAGQITAGDKVDILGTVNNKTAVVASNVPIIAALVSEDKFSEAANQQTGDEKNTDPNTLLPAKPIPGIYLVRVTQADAIKLVSVQENGNLTLLWNPENATQDPAVTSVCGLTTC